MWNKNVETYLCCGSEFDDADIVLFGAPFDGTASNRPGTRFGPSAIRRESQGLESYSLYQDKDLADLGVFDGGDIELAFGNPGKTLLQIEEKTTLILDSGKLPFLLGGEHLATLGAFRAAAEKYSEIRLVHFDAHADLRDRYLGESLSHATVIRRCHDIVGDGRIFQFGIRSADRSEFEWNRAKHTHMHLYDTQGVSQTIEHLFGLPVYLTVDLDILDPSVMPGTGTPEPGGVGFDELRRAVTAVCSSCKVVGCDVVELSPPLDPSGISAAAAGKIVREMLLALSIDTNIR